LQIKKPDIKLNLAIPDILKNNRFLIIAGALLFIVVAGGIVSLFLAGRQGASDQAGSSPDGSGLDSEQESADEAIVLPQQVRNEDFDGETSWQLFRSNNDPFAQPMKLTGIVTGGRGGSTAIIEAGGSSYIVFEGDYVYDYWAVRLIAGDMVVLRAGDQEIFLYFDQPPVTRTLDLIPDEEDPEEGA
jgi:hypothetical protein